METALEVRNIIFWWLGNWALFTLIDAAIVAAVLKVIGHNQKSRK